MTPLFLDTAYVYALLNTRDEWHERAKNWQAFLAARRQTLITTEFILVEIGDGLANLRFRKQAIDTIDALRSSALVEIVPASSDLLAKAIDLYRDRTDKEWGVTDCTSFLVMQTHGIQDALTCDEDFIQAGFQALLRQDPS
jgi:predicted nucleic acid-binding protein